MMMTFSLSKSNLSIYLCVCLYVHQPARPSARPSIHSSIRPSIHPSMHPSTHPFILLSIYLSIYLFVCQSVYPQFQPHITPSIPQSSLSLSQVVFPYLDDLCMTARRQRHFMKLFKQMSKSLASH